MRNTTLENKSFRQKKLDGALSSFLSLIVTSGMLLIVRWAEWSKEWREYVDYHDQVLQPYNPEYDHSSTDFFIDIFTPVATNAIITLLFPSFLIILFYFLKSRLKFEDAYFVVRFASSMLIVLAGFTIMLAVFVWIFPSIHELVLDFPNNSVVVSLYLLVILLIWRANKSLFLKQLDMLSNFGEYFGFEPRRTDSEKLKNLSQKAINYESFIRSIERGMLEKLDEASEINYLAQEFHSKIWSGSDGILKLQQIVLWGGTLIAFIIIDVLGVIEKAPTKLDMVLGLAIMTLAALFLGILLYNVIGILILRSIAVLLIILRFEGISRSFTALLEAIKLHGGCLIIERCKFKFGRTRTGDRVVLDASNDLDDALWSVSGPYSLLVLLPSGETRHIGYFPSF